MKNLVIVFIVINFANSTFCQNNAVVVLANEKFSQFLNLRDFSISKSNDEIYFTTQSPSQEISQILYLKKVKGKWSNPQLMPFSNVYSDLEPFLSFDQNTLYFASNRGTPDTNNNK